MVTLAQAQAGVGRYIEAEIISKIQGWQRWVIGAGASRALSRSTDIFNQIKDNGLIKMMGIIDDATGQIDIDALHQEFAKQAEHGAITFHVPLVGALTLDKQDVDRIYQYIIGGL